MRITGPSGTGVTANTRETRRSTSGSFTLDSPDPTPAAKAPAAPNSLGGIDALIALQGVEEPTERRKRIASALADRVLGILGSLPIEVEAPLRAPGGAVALARAHELTVYDAMYLETAIRRALPLATLEGDLQRAARTTGVALLL